jgi:S-DNA-T family DNA segregation ATPase FtsK/SpoIIIE
MGLTGLKNIVVKFDVYRLAAVAGAVVLGLLALFLGVSIAGALLRLPFLFPAAGNFFARIYGILAFIIPVYLLYAAFILADPSWRPDRIFILGVSILPFLTLAGGFALVRDFENKVAYSPFLDFTGPGGLSFLVILFTIIETILIIASVKLLFPGPGGSRIKRIDLSRVRRRSTLKTLLLPAPKMNPPDYLQGIVYPQQVNASARTVLDSPIAEEDNEAEVLEQDVEILEQYVDEADGIDETEEDGAEVNLPGDVEQALSEAEILAGLHSRKPAAARSGQDNTADEPAGRGKSPEAASYSLHKPRLYKVPAEILNQYPDGEYWIIDQATRDAAVTLKETLEEFKIQAEVTGIRKGPVITMFEILPAPGVKLSRITNLADNIALRLAASSVRIVAPIPGKHAVGIEVPNAKRNIVSFREIIEGELCREGKKLEIPVVLGKDISGEAQTVDLVQMPHLLIAGATGSGKSVCVNAMILSILYQKQPAECRLILIDPKIVELKLYNDIPHLLTQVITEPKRAFQALQYCIYEMERRYACLDSMGVRDIRSYNRRIKEKNMAAEHMPYIVVVIDEFADLMATTGKELESTLARLAAMSRAVGIHLVLATQRPSIDVITGLIKANIPSRIAFMVASKMDSRIIIDMVGAEKLLGKGDMLYAGAVDPFPIRMQGAFVSEEEVEAVVEHVKTLGKPDYIDDEMFYDDDEEDLSPSLFSDGDDPLYEKALEVVMQQGKASASYLQRRLKIGYNRAARLVEEMEHRGVVGPAQGSKPRELLRAV